MLFTLDLHINLVAHEPVKVWVLRLGVKAVGKTLLPFSLSHFFSRMETKTGMSETETDGS
jgi:hypothetical protein